ncbi:MAG: Polysaccharide biosynthesis protein [Methanosaeta sp. PtaB.Bin018]|nr:MAG: Polysaccharide biosynthesis protein [Methanosaeta sp. PtaB.Bin018]
MIVNVIILKTYRELNLYFSEPLLKNSIHLITNSFATSGLGFIFWIIAARFYDSYEVGLASAIVSSMSLLTVLSLLGFNISLIKFLPNSNGKEDLINSCFTLDLCVSSIISIIFLLGINTFSPELSFLKENLIFSIFYIIFTATGVIGLLLNSIFIANRLSKNVLLKDSIFGISKIPLTMFAIFLGAFGIFFAWGIALMISSIIGMALLFKIIPQYKPKIFIEKELIRNMFHFSFWNYIAHVLSLAPASILPIMITNMLSADAAAYFYISWMIANLLFSIPAQSTQALLAECSNFEQKIRENINKSLKFILLLLIPPIVIILFMGDKLLLLFGREYSIESFKMLQLLAISAFPYSINSLFISIKRVKKETNSVVLIYFIMAFIALVGSYMLVPYMGLTGVGIAWLFGNLVTSTAIVFKVAKDKFSKHLI